MIRSAIRSLRTPLCCGVLFALSSSAFGWQAAQQFAHPDGEDEYGTVYKVKPDPIVIEVPLDEFGDYVVPNFVASTVLRDDQDQFVLLQSPAPGTVLSCPQTVKVDFMDTSVASGGDPWSSFDLKLVDRTPPTVQIALNSATTPHTSFGGVQRYAGTPTVDAAITVTDGCDAQAGAQEILLNGQPYTPGDPITERGLHILQVVGVDASGNEISKQKVFEIQPRPSEVGTAVVKSLSYETDSAGLITAANVQLLFGGESFDHLEVLLSSVRLMAVDQTGSWVNVSPTALINAFEEDCNRLRHEQVGVLLNPCYSDFTFRADFSNNPLANAPLAFDIVGAGGNAAGLTFEWGVRVPATSDPDAEQAILQLLQREDCDDLPPWWPWPPPPEPEHDCEKVETWIMPVTDYCGHTGTGAPGTGLSVCSNVYARTVATAASKSAHGLSISDCKASGGSAPSHIASCTAASGCGRQSHSTMVVVEMVGSECCACEIEFNLTAGVRASAEVQIPLLHSTGSAFASGAIGFITPCGNDIASATASVSTILLDQFEVVEDQCSLTCVDDSCTSMLVIHTSAELSTSASAGHTIGPATRAFAKSLLESAPRAVTAINGTFSPCEPEECEP